MDALFFVNHWSVLNWKKKKHRFVRNFPNLWKTCNERFIFCQSLICTQLKKKNIVLYEIPPTLRLVRGYSCILKSPKSHTKYMAEFARQNCTKCPKLLEIVRLQILIWNLTYRGLPGVKIFVLKCTKNIKGRDSALLGKYKKRSDRRVSEASAQPIYIGMAF